MRPFLPLVLLLAGCIAPAEATTTFQADAVVDIVMTELISSGGKTGPVNSAFKIGPLNLATGTTDGQINAGYYKRETGIGSAVTTEYDLVGGLTNTEGTTVNLDEVVILAVRNLGTTATQYLSVGPDVTEGFGVVASNKGFWADASDRTIIPADGNSWVVLHAYGGVPAAAASTDDLAIITQAVTGNTYDLLILGRDN